MSKNDDRLKAALERVFYPLASLLVNRGIGVQFVINIQKKAFVKAAIDKQRNAGKKDNISKVAVLTGLTRQTVRKIWADVDAQKVNSDLFCFSDGAVLTAWRSNPDFLDSKGNPKSLSLGSGPGSFEELTKNVSSREPDSEIIARLKATGSVRCDSNGDIRLVKNEQLTKQDLPQLLLDSIATLASTLDHNLSVAPEDGFCQRVAYSLQINPDLLPVLRRNLRSKIIQFIEEVDDQLWQNELRGEATMSPAPLAPQLIGVNAYYFEMQGEEV